MSDERVTYLADGRAVPTACVEALDEFETRWPGASFPGARAGLVAAVLAALGEPAVEYRVTGMPYRGIGGQARTESSSVYRVEDSDDDDEFRGLVQQIQRSRGGTVQRRLVVETEWEDLP